MRAAPNLGAEYRQAFDSIYPRLAQKYDLPLYPFFLDGVAGEHALELEDGLHPNAKGIALMVERILPSVEQAIAALPGNS
jgi:acyl-CoA thioesterase-1